MMRRQSKVIAKRGCDLGPRIMEGGRGIKPEYPTRDKHAVENG